MIRPFVSILFLIAFFGCGNIQTLNSSAEDEARYGSSDAFAIGATDGPRFLAARDVLINRCVSCHQWVGNYLEADFISNGKVVASNAAGSVLFLRIRGNDANATNANMPPSGSMTDGELATIKAWINGI